MAVTTIFVCDTCAFSTNAKTDAAGRTGGEVLAGLVERTAAGVEGVEVRRQSCLMGCEHPCNAAVTGAGKLSYVLGRFAPDGEAAAAVVEYARLHAESAKGQVPFRSWPQGVKGHFIARIPSLEG